MESERVAVDTLVGLTGRDRDEVAAIVRRLVLAGIRDPKRLIFKVLQAFPRTAAID